MLYLKHSLRIGTVKKLRPAWLITTGFDQSLHINGLDDGSREKCLSQAQVLYLKINKL